MPEIDEIVGAEEDRSELLSLLAPPDPADRMKVCGPGNAHCRSIGTVKTDF